MSRRRNFAVENPTPVIEGKARSALVLTCHEPYAKYLDDTMESIEAQGHELDGKILILDGFNWDGQFEAAKRGWKVLATQAGHPNVARNEALKHIAEDIHWVTFWDADNVMPKGYLARLYKAANDAPEDVGFVYPSQGRVTPDGDKLDDLVAPAYDYWKLRHFPYVSMCSFWRRAAIDQAGGFNPTTKQCDDWDLALRITELGWKGKKAGAKMTNLVHGENRSSHDGKEFWHPGWHSRSLKVVTLWSPNAHINAVTEYMAKEKWPPRTKFIWVDNTGSRRMNKTLQAMAMAVPGPVEIWVEPEPFRYDQDDQYFDIRRHQHIAKLYNKALRAYPSDMVMFIEDDNVGEPGQLKTLYEAFYGHTQIASVSGTYRSRTNPEYCCAAGDLAQAETPRWSRHPKYDEVGEDRRYVAKTGGGFTLYAGWALDGLPPLRCEKLPEGLCGWDGFLGAWLHQRGYRVCLDGRVRVEHRCHEVLEWLRKNPETQAA